MSAYALEANIPDLSESSMKQTKQIVILGGSFGGLSVAHYTLQHIVKDLPDSATWKVLVMFPQDKLFVDISRMFEAYSQAQFEFFHGTVKKVDHTDTRTVEVETAEGSTLHIRFDALVIATGASTYSPLLGLNGDAEILRKHWREFRKALPSARSIAIAGGGPAGIETAGELGEYLNKYQRTPYSESCPPKVSITVFSGGASVLPALRPSLGLEAERQLAKVGVTVIKNVRVMQVSPVGAGDRSVASGPVALTLDNGEVHQTDLYIPAVGMKPNTDFLDETLLAADNRVKTTPSTLRLEDAGPRLYAIGDVSTYARPAVHLILKAVPILCANMKRDLLLYCGLREDQVGRDEIHKEDKSETQLVPIGKTQGLGAAMGFKMPGLIVRFLKGKDYWLWTTEKIWSGKQWK